MPQYDSNGKIPEDLYIIGHDPFAEDSAQGESLASVYVIKTKEHWDKYGHDEIVASYIGRPYRGRDAVNEILLKLSMFYGNAKIYFENVRGNVKEYFEKAGRLDLLARSPRTVFTTKSSSELRPSGYGVPMANRKMKLDGISYLRDWLIEEREQVEGRTLRNLDVI